MKFFFAIVLLTFLYAIAFAQNSENGYWCPNKGTLRVLVVYAEVVNDPNYDKVTSSAWQAGEMPANPDYYFSAKAKSDDGLMTRYFHEASFGSFNLIGDYFPELIQIDYKKAGYQSVSQVVAAINAYNKRKLKSSSGHLVNSNYFDSWSFSGFGMPKTNAPDSMLDLILIVWRVNSKLTTVSNSGYCSVTALRAPIRNYKGVNCYSEFVSHDNNAFIIMRHEFSHTLYGPNNFHTAGPGAGRRAFINGIGGFSNLSSWDACGAGWNAWDRWRMGWKNPAKQYLTSACEKTGGGFVEKDFESYEYTTDSVNVYIRDFQTTGDALRIKLPCIDSPSLHQYLWLEFHADTSMLDIDHESHTGLYAYIEVGKDNKKDVSSNDLSSPGNYLYFLPASGRFDFEYGMDSVRKKIYLRKDNSLSNPLTGNHSLMRPMADMNHDNKLTANEIINPEMIITPDKTDVTYPIFGSPDDAFKPVNKTIMNICSNPSSSNVTTYNYPHSKSVYDEDTVYINGLHVEITDSGDVRIEKGKVPAIGLKINWNDYNISHSVRWCGNIVLKPIDKKVILDVTNNSVLLLDRGLSITQDVINKTDTLDGKLYFSQPTTFICYPNTVIHIHEGSMLRLINKSTLIMKKGSELITDDGAKVIVDATSKIIKE